MIFQWGGGGGSVHALPWMHNQSTPLPLMTMRTKKNFKNVLMLSMGHLSIQYGTSLYTGGEVFFMNY